MTSEQKTAIARIVSDIIKADNILDISEMQFYEQLAERLKISNDHLVNAQKMDFAKSVDILRNMSKQELRIFIKEMEHLTIVDGDCAPEEALLVIALDLCLSPSTQKYCKLISTGVTNISIDKGNIIYTETEYDVETNAIISNHLRYITNDFHIAGLNFVYIPQIVRDFNEMKPEYLMSVVKFLAPGIGDTKQKEIYDTLRNITTKSFCENFLVRKMGLDQVYDSEPSLLFQVCESNGRLVYMHISLGNDVLRELASFVDRYKELTLVNKTFLTHNKTNRQFIYRGFHRSLFDLLAFPGKRVESRVLFDERQKRISFIDLGKDLHVPTKQMALYMFIVQQSICGKTHEIRIKDVTDRQMQVIEKSFAKVYGMLSTGENSGLRNNLTANLSKLRKAIKELDYLENVNSYLPEITEHGTIRMTIKPSKVYVFENDNMIPISESKRWNKI